MAFVGTLNRKDYGMRNGRGMIVHLFAALKA